ASPLTTVSLRVPIPLLFLHLALVSRQKKKGPLVEPVHSAAIKGRPSGPSAFFSGKLPAARAAALSKPAQPPLPPPESRTGDDGSQARSNDDDQPITAPASSRCELR